jgi:hypothetical protein
MTAPEKADTIFSKVEESETVVFAGNISFIVPTSSINNLILVCAVLIIERFFFINLETEKGKRKRFFIRALENKK